MSPAWLVGARALGALPVALIDVVAALYLLRVWRRSSAGSASDPFAALPLALFFLALASLALCEALMMSSLDVTTSFRLNFVGQSVSVTMTAPPIVMFAYAFLGRSFPKEARVVGPLVTLASLAVVVAFVMSALDTRSSELSYDFVAEHTHRISRSFDLLDDAIPVVLLSSYAVALSVLVRKWRMLSGRRRNSALSFALVIVLAIVGVVVNRLEAVASALPIGTYTTYMLWVTLAALLLFVMHTDEITRFHDRIAALVLVAVLAAMALLAERAVSGVQSGVVEQRHDDAVSKVHGDHPSRALFARPATTERAGDVVGTDPLSATVIDVVDGTAVGFSYLAARKAVDDVAFPAVVAMILAALFVLLVIPPLAEVSVLRPLRRLERADADSRAKSVFLAQMSHELRTPLNAILHHARMLADGPGDKADVAARADVLVVSAEHLLALIEALLHAGKNDAGAGSLTALLVPEPTPVRALVDDVVSMHRAAIERKGLFIRVDVDVASAVLVDRRTLRQVLSNLIGNASKYTDSGGISVRGSHSAGRLRLIVEDTGPGVAAAVREQVFLPFFQVAPTDGAGLGLAIARQLVEAMGGSLEIDATAPGQGALFIVDVAAPLCDAPLSSSASSPSTSGALLQSLPAALKEELLALARVGDVVTLRARAKDLAGQDATAGFGEALDKLAARFQVRAIRRLLGDDA